MLLLQPRGDRLEIVDANDAALRMLGEEHGPLVGRYLDRVLDNPAVVRASIAADAGRRPGRLDARRPGWSARPGTRVDIAVSLISGGHGAGVRGPAARRHRRAQRPRAGSRRPRS